MDLPFTVEEFFHVFELYNRSVWPAQLLLSALAIAALIFAVRDTKSSGVIVSLILQSIRF